MKSQAVRIKIADHLAMARMLYAANCAFKAVAPIQFGRLSPVAQDAYMKAARAIMEVESEAQADRS